MVLMHCFVMGEPLEWHMNRDSCGHGCFPSVFRREINWGRFRAVLVPGQNYVCKPSLTHSQTWQCRLSSVRIYVRTRVTRMVCDRFNLAMAETAKLVLRK